MIPVAYDVAAFLGRSGDAAFVDLAYTHLKPVTAMVRAYTRGKGFIGDEPADDLAAVIVSSTARIVANPSSTIEHTAGPFSSKPAVFNGWTLPELTVLNRYRKKAL